MRLVSILIPVLSFVSLASAFVLPAAALVLPAAALVLPAAALAADPILQQHFTTGTEGWAAKGSGTLTAADGSLTLRYEAAVATLPTQTLPLSEMKSLRFELKTDTPFAVAVGIGPARAVVWSSGDVWQPVVLAPRDFTGNPGKGGAITLMDFTQYLLALDHDPRVYAEPHKGEHTISIRNFEILRDAPDSDQRPQVEWFGTGGAAFEQAGAVLTVRYRPMEDLWTAFTRLMNPPDAAGATHLALDIQSARDAQLALSIRDGDARHTVDFFVPAGKKPEHREVLLAAFQPKGLNPATVRSLTILDVAGDSGPNELKIAHVAFVRR